VISLAEQRSIQIERNVPVSRQIITFMNVTGQICSTPKISARLILARVQFFAFPDGRGRQ